MWNCRLKASPWLFLSICLVFNPKKIAPPLFSITIFHTCIKVTIKGCASVCFPSLFLSRVRQVSTTITLPLGVMEWGLSTPREVLWPTTSYNKLSLFYYYLGPPAKVRAWSPKGTAQPSGLWISLNTGHCKLSCMQIISLVQFQIN